MSVLERIQEPTPKFFRVLRTIGMCLVAAGGALVAAPVALPAVVLTIAGYLTVAGTDCYDCGQSVGGGEA
jgi:hypothetical protein